jgi:hypothetical protein
MANTKISALPASTTPLAGTEVLPIVQSSTTKQVSVANLTAGRAISATQLTLTTGNLIVANGQGIDFSATPSTGTSELLADYEEGVWTPALAINTPGNLSVTYSTQTGYYTKIGRLVTVSFQVETSAFTWTTASGVWRISGVPFLSSGNTTYMNGAISAFQGITKANYTTFGSQTNTGTAQFLLQASGSGQAWDYINAADLPSGGSIMLRGSFTFIV